MIRAVTDTHTIIWYLYDDARLSPTARTWIENAAVTPDPDRNHVSRITHHASRITLAEMVYLIEKGRINARR